MEATRIESMPPIHEERVALPSGATIWYETRGDPQAPAVLLIMGHGSQGIEWPESFRNALAAAGRYVICFDNRDAGCSEDFEKRWEAGERYLLFDMVADILALLDHLSLQRPHVFGYSMGGVLAQHLAHPDTDRASSLILFASTPAWGQEGLPPSEERYMSVLSPAPADDFESRVSYVERVWRSMCGSAYPYDAALLDPLLRRVIERGYSTGRLRRQFHAARNASRPRGKAPTVPTWVYHGDEDPVAPIEHAEVLCQRIPQAKLRLFPGLGHQPHPEVLAELLPEILGNTEKNGR
jgi:pimeloyl-ACP methyl ester carboxylesterase